MNYYNRHIGDYMIDTAHLSMLEDGAYNRMLDRYYTAEQPLTSDESALFRILRARTDEEKDAVRAVLADFFTLTDAGWKHKRCTIEIDAYQAKAEANRANGVKGGRPKKDQEEPTKNPEITQVVSEQITQAEPKLTLTKNQEPITNNHKPVSKKPSATASRLPTDWEPTEADLEFLKAERPDLSLRETAATFRDYWVSRADSGAKKADWHATWRNWVRNQRGLQQARASPGYQTPNEKAKTLADRLTGKTKNDQQPDFIDIN